MKNVMNLIRRALNGLGYLIYLMISSFFLMEISLRILPTTQIFSVQETTAQNPVIRYEKNKQLTSSLGWNFYQISEKKTNNYGFVSSIDYVKKGKPDLVVIGDSYVEAMQVDNNKAVSEMINALNENINTYAIGVSGVPLSQYIKFIEFAEMEFDPKEYLIVIVGNDFDQSLCSYRRKEGTFCFDENFELQLIPFLGYSTLRKIGRSSALFRYIVLNVGFNWRQIISKIGISDNGLEASAKFAGNTERFKVEEIVELSYQVIDNFVSRVASISDGKKVSILVDADRYDIYRGVKTESYFNTMRKYLMEQALQKGLSVIDMEPVFRKHFIDFGKRFEFPTDGHWNELGHELAANAYLAKRN